MALDAGRKKPRALLQRASCGGETLPDINLFQYTINNMQSARFNRTVILTSHAILRMIERNITESELLAVIDTGEIKYKDETHLWAYKHLDNRTDNLICAVLILETAVVVKTVMHEFTLEA